ncbi:MAG: Peptidase S24-like protein [Methanobacterium sp. PtaU1.Bin097]|jgi:signal peptidase|nr:MAG: Peptidase S24-like protein [Methanobacterium sp. PtaU1.Bin097]
MTDTKEILSYVAIIIIGILLAQHLNVVVSGSMEPTFARGDVVVIQKANFFGLSELNTTNLEVGDVVIYDATWFPEPVIHRIIEKGTNPDGRLYYVIKGDNNPGPDQAPVYPEQIQAKVISFGENPGENLFVIPYIGQITLWIRGL